MSAQEVIVRRARAQDVPGIVVTSSLLFAEDGGERDPGLNVESMSGPTAMRPVASATLMALYVRPEHRRSRVGARMVDTFLAWARERGAAHAEVTASAANAIRFYEREEFRPRRSPCG